MENHGSEAKKATASSTLCLLSGGCGLLCVQSLHNSYFPPSQYGALQNDRSFSSYPILTLKPVL